MRGPKREHDGKRPAPRPANASEDLYELNVDDRFRDRGELNLDSSLGAAAEPEDREREEPHDPTD